MARGDQEKHGAESRDEALNRFWIEESIERMES